MTIRRPKLVARIGLLLAAGFCALWLTQLDYSRKISTNVLDLVPRDERSPELALVRSFADDVQSRVMLFALRDAKTPGQPPTAAAEQFAAALRQAPEFADAVVLGAASDQEQLGRAIYEQRFRLLLPGWLGEHERAFAETGRPASDLPAWLADRAAAELETFLARPEAAAMQDIVVADPLLLVPRLVQHVQLTGEPGANAGDHALIWARIRPSPLTEAGQQPVFAAIDHALAAVRAARPGLELRWTGINRFAAASRHRIEAEISTLNLLSIGAVLVVCAIFVRRIVQVVHLIPVIVLSIAGAWTISTLCIDRLHILVFVIGSLLSGVAIDYGVYIFMQPYLRPDEPYSGKLRRLLKPLLASCLTTVIGFSLLLFSNLPLIREVGLFVAAGLLCALGAAMVYFAQLERPLMAGRDFGVLKLGHNDAGRRRLAFTLLAVAAVVAIIGTTRLRWRDDIRELDISTPELHANEAAVRALFGESDSRTLYLTYGATAAEARQNLENFHTYLHQQAPGLATSSLGLLLPTEADWQALPARLAQLGGFADAFRAALQQHGFSPGSFEAFFNSWRDVRADPPRGDYAQLQEQVTRLLTGPLSMLASTHAPYWFLTIAEENIDRPVPEALHSLGINQLQSLNRLFTQYRWSALRLSVIGLALVIASVFAIYPWRRGIRIALIPAGSCLFVFGVFGLTGQTLNLFNLLGAFLGVCLSHNYAIFSAETRQPGGAPPISIRLSAFSAATSFGVLAFSHIPVIHSLGLTVSLIVLTALAAVEIDSMARRTAA